METTDFYTQFCWLVRTFQEHLGYLGDFAVFKNIREKRENLVAELEKRCGELNSIIEELVEGKVFPFENLPNLPHLCYKNYHREFLADLLSDPGTRFAEEETDEKGFDDYEKGLIGLLKIDSDLKLRYDNFRRDYLIDFVCARSYAESKAKGLKVSELSEDKMSKLCGLNAAWLEYMLEMEGMIPSRLEVVKIIGKEKYAEMVKEVYQKNAEEIKEAVVGDADFETSPKYRGFVKKVVRMVKKSIDDSLKKYALSLTPSCYQRVIDHVVGGF